MTSGARWAGQEPERDEFDDYLDKAMRDPAFAAAYRRAEWIDARWWRRLLSRWGWRYQP